MYLMSIIFRLLIIVNIFTDIHAGNSHRNLRNNNNDNRSIIQLRNGAKILGKKFHRQYSNKTLEVFYSIKYAQQSKYRFGLAQPFEIQDKYYDARYKRERCPSLSSSSILFDFMRNNNDNSRKQSENCLYLNIWKPETSETRLSIIVWLEMSGFLQADNKMFNNGIDYVNRGDVIFVSIQFRTDVFGFLYAGNERAPGNQGIYDVILALKWIQSNIESFGGDPTRVTVMGQSIGSIITSVLILSPMAKGLFHRAIMHSGSISDSKQFSPEYSIIKTRKFARNYGCFNAKIDLIIECLEAKSFDEFLLNRKNLLAIASSLEIFEGKSLFIIYNDFHGILPDYPSALIDNGQLNPVDLIFGHTFTESGPYFSFRYPFLLPSFTQFSKKELHEILFKISQKFMLPSQEFDKIYDFYAGNIQNQPISGQILRELVTQILSDAIVTCPMHLFARGIQRVFDNERNFAANDSSIYSFRFDYRHSPLLSIIGCFDWMQTCQLSDLPYLLGLPKYLSKPFDLLLFNRNDFNISNSMIDTWINFINTGQIDEFMHQKWPKYHQNQPTSNDTTWKQMIIDLQPKIIENYYDKRCRIWESLILPNMIQNNGEDNSD